MIIAIILALIGIGFLVLAIKGNKIEPAVKTKKLVNGIRILLLISPLIAAAIFAVLFCTVLTGRLVERSSHALIVFCLWAYGTAFYVNVLKFFKSKLMIFINLIGMIVSVAFAILLTPLDRYCELMFDSVHEMTYVLGSAMFVIWYISILIFGKIKE